MLKQYFVVFVSIFLDILSLAVVVKVIMSWFNYDRSSRFAIFLEDITRPVLAIFKKITPKLGYLDLSPIIALLAIDLIKGIFLSLFS
jgi:YggT family protein